MHSHERTLLASLGFNDPDKREPLHDLACRYIGKNWNKVCEIILTPKIKSGKKYAWELKDCIYECLIAKGKDQYRTHIGFMDVVIRFRGITGEEVHHGAIVVEVKIKPIPVNNMIRQMKLYRMHSPLYEDVWWVIATTFPLSIEEVNILNQEKIDHIILDTNIIRQTTVTTIAPSPKL